MPKTQDLFQKHLDVSEEKTQAIANILEKLAVMSEDEVLAIEKDFEVITVNY